MLKDFPADQTWAGYILYGDPAFRLPQPTQEEWRPGRSGTESVHEHRALFVGRDRELAEAKTCLQNALRNQASVLLVSGEAGIGKSAFIEEFAAISRGEFPTAVWACGVCDAQMGLSDAYLPFKEILRDLARNDRQRIQSPSPKVSNVSLLLAKALYEVGPDLLRAFSPFTGLDTPSLEGVLAQLGLREEGIKHRADLNQTGVFDQYTEAILGIAAVAPMVLILDDLHWADDASLALFFHLARRISGRPVLLLATYDPHDVAHGRQGKEHPLKGLLNQLRRFGARTISLDWDGKGSTESRARDFIRQYLNARYSPNVFPDRFTDLLLARTRGNALFVIELLKNAEERDEIKVVDGTWKILVRREISGGREPELPALPDRIDAVIEERIGRLTKDLKDILTAASVEGDHFTAQVMARVGQVDEDRLLEFLEGLDTVHGLVQEKGERSLGRDQILSFFGFQHPLVQEHFYRHLSETQRRLLHRKVGRCLEELYGQDAEEIAPQLARHFDRARDHERAFRYYRIAARRAMAEFATDEAIFSYSAALRIWDQLEGKELAAKLELLRELGNVYKFKADFPEAIESHETCLKLAKEAHNKLEQAWAINNLADIRRSQGDYSKAEALYKECEIIAGVLENEELLIEVATDLAELYGDVSERLQADGRSDPADIARKSARTYAEKVIAQGANYPENVRRAFGALGNICVHLKDFPTGMEMYEKSLVVAEKHNLARQAYDRLGDIARIQGKYEKALELYEKYLKWTMEVGSKDSQVIAYNNMGMLHSETGEYAKALNFFETSLALNEIPSGWRNQSYAIESYIMKGEVFQKQARPEDALECYRNALRLQGAFREEDTPATVIKKVGSYLLARGEVENAKYFLTQYLQMCPDAADATEIAKVVQRST
jgi:predicted ATPase